jgi:uncharacterized protein YukE
MGEIRVDPEQVASAGAALASAARRLADAHAGLARTADAGGSMNGEPAVGAYARMQATWLAELRALADDLRRIAGATSSAASAYVETDAAAMAPTEAATR